MATAVQLRRGTSAQVSAFTGLIGECVVDTTTNTLVVGDGSTAGGFALARADFDNISASAALTLGTLTATQVDLTAQGDLRLQDAAGGQYAALQAPTTVSASYTLTMPGAVGASGQVLRTSDGAGALEWYTPDTGDITAVTAGNGLTGGGSSGDVTLNAAGTADRISVSADAIDIAASYIGQATLTTLGTVSTGTWSASVIADAYIANDLTISGGTVDNSVIGGSTAAAITGTTIVANTSLALATGATVTGIDNGSLGSSATLLATQGAIKTYVDAQVGAVDTLSEILANGNTTGGTDLAVSANDDITFTDSSKALFGAGLQIYHDASHSYVKDVGTGDLRLMGTNLSLRSEATNEPYLNATENGSVDLFYNNDKKFETTNTGVGITGEITATTATFSTSLALATGATVTGIDNGSLGSSATLLATQGAIKTYIDDLVTAQDLDITTDSGSIDIDLDSDTLTMAGGTGLDSSATGTTVTFAIDSTVATLAGSQTLTNKSISGSTNTLSNIANGSLSNSTVSYGGVSLALGSSDATPAFNLADASGYTGDSSLVTVGTITTGAWQGTAVAKTYVDGSPSGDYVGSTDSQTLTNKTLTSPVLNGSLSGTAFLNENDFASNSSVAAASQASIKVYVDDVASGLTLQSAAHVATTAALTVTYDNGSSGVGATLTNSGTQAALSLDGQTLVAAERVLVKDQASALQNGLYTVTNVGSGASNWVMTRATDFDTSADMHSASFVFVETGTVNADSGWVMTTDGTITVGTTAITWTQFSSSAAILAGDGLTKVGSTIDAVGTADRISVNGGIDISSSYIGQGTITTVGALNAGSITSGFGAIDIGASTLATTGAVSTGSLHLHVASSGAIYSQYTNTATGSASGDGWRVGMNADEDFVIDGQETAESFHVINNGATRLTIDNNGNTYGAAGATGGWYLDAASGDASAGNPQYTFSGNTGTGLRRASTDVIAFDTGATERARFLANGHFMIGDDVDVGYQLHVRQNDASRADIARFENNTNGGDARVLISAQANESGDPYLYFDAGGTDFAIGELWASGDNKMTIGKAIPSSFAAGDGIVIDQNGKVGIGTVSPESTFVVAHDSTASAINAVFRSNEATSSQRAGGGFAATGHATASSRYANMWLDPDGANFGGSDYFYIQKDGDGGDVRVIQQNASNLDFQTDGTLRFRIDADGNIGQGFTTPSAWHSDFRAIQFGTGGSGISGGATGSRNINVSNNAYLDTSGDWVYIGTDHAANIEGYDGTWHFKVAASGTAGADITWTEALALNNDGTAYFGDNASANLDYFRTGSYGSHASNLFYRNRDSSETSLPVVKIMQDHASDDQDALVIDQDGNASGIHIDTEATTAPALYVLSPKHTTGNVIQVFGANDLTDGTCLALHSDSEDTSTRNLAYIVNDNALATGTTALKVQQDAAAIGIHVRSGSSGGTAHASADELVVEGSENSGIQILSGTGSEGAIYFGDSGDNNNGVIRYDHNNLTMDMFVAAGERLTIGQHAVGIDNAALETWHSSFAPLQLGGAASLMSHVTQSDGSSFHISNNAYYDSTNSRWEYISTSEDDEAANYYMQDGAHYFRVAPSGADDAAITWNTVLSLGNNSDVVFYDDDGSTVGMTWDASSNSLGIGSPNPDYKLVVKGTDANLRIKIEATAAAATAGIYFLSNGGGAGATLRDDRANAKFGFIGGTLWEFDNSITLTAGTLTTPSLAVDGGSVKLDGNYPDGSNNVALGNTALDSLSAGSEGSSNTAVGDAALTAVSTGNYNTAFGANAGIGIAGGSYNSILGYNIDSSTSANYGISIGTGFTHAASQITFGAGSNLTYKSLTATAWTFPSDARIKKNIADEMMGLDFINLLQPRTFKWRSSKSIDKSLESQHSATEELRDTQTTQHGFIAQEVKEAMNAVGIPDTYNLWSERDDGTQGLAPAELVIPLVNAVKELSATVEVLREEIETLKRG